MTQARFSNLTILKSHKERTEKLCLVGIANKFAGRNDNRNRTFGGFKATDLAIPPFFSRAVTPFGYIKFVADTVKLNCVAERRFLNILRYGFSVNFKTNLLHEAGYCNVKHR